MSCAVPHAHFLWLYGAQILYRSTTIDNADSGDVAIAEAKLKEIEDAVKESGIKLGETVHEMGGWQGGTVWLVPTERGIENWKPIATRTL